MKKIKHVNYDFAPNGAITRATIQYEDGTVEVVSDSQKLIEVQTQLRNQSKQILMEGSN